MSNHSASSSYQPKPPGTLNLFGWDVPPPHPLALPPLILFTYLLLRACYFPNLPNPFPSNLKTPTWLARPISRIYPRSSSSSSSSSPPPQSNPFATEHFPDNKPWPLPSPEPSDFRLSEAKEPKYRPFKWGPDYNINMGIRPLDPTQWLVLHSSYPSYAALRLARHEVYAEKSCRTLAPPKTMSYGRPYPSLTSENPNVDPHRLAALEAARCIASFLAHRYPMLFELEPKEAFGKQDDGWSVKAIRRVALPSAGLKEMRWTLIDEYDVQGALDRGEQCDDPMRVAGELVPDDLAILLPDPKGKEEEGGEEAGSSTSYRFIAGSICTAGFWRLTDKIGLTLRDIHLKGKVPQYETKLMNPMDRFFSKLQPSKPVERNNYFFQVLEHQSRGRQGGTGEEERHPLESVKALLDGTLIPDIVSKDDEKAKPLSGGEGVEVEPGSTDQSDRREVSEREVRDRTELSWSHSSNGPERLYDQVLKGPLPVVPRKEGEQREEETPFKPPQPTRDPSYVVMRTERQTLRRLARSNAIIFTIRTYLVPLTEMAKERGVPGRLASAMRSWPEDVKWYKGSELYSDCVLPYLDEMHQKQVEELGLQVDLDHDPSQRGGGVESERERARKNYPF
ncbi:hypothetical protein IE53DRAFT_388526 [Violaceomyces palustris]|uniref:Uncharacterized protein n=1 Tax=Violaceomyces palustris TaxID=1673888 RepID=A0ACD0NTV4_9BASI|nr:hypothetical protein IE53DRAFT_388526 [Violaceomyces palustris]